MTMALICIISVLTATAVYVYQGSLVVIEDSINKLKNIFLHESDSLLICVCVCECVDRLH